MKEKDKKVLKVVERLEVFRQHLDLSKPKFATRIGMSAQHYRNVVNGYSGLTIDRLIQLAETYEALNLHWLLKGEEEMIRVGPFDKDDLKMIKLEAERNLLLEVLEKMKKKD